MTPAERWTRWRRANAALVAAHREEYRQLRAAALDRLPPGPAPRWRPGQRYPWGRYRHRLAASDAARVLRAHHAEEYRRLLAAQPAPPPPPAASLTVRQREAYTKPRANGGRFTAPTRTPRLGVLTDTDRAKLDDLLGWSA